MDFMKQQLDQMRDEQRMSEQPVLDVIDLKFEIERPVFITRQKDTPFNPDISLH